MKSGRRIWIIFLPLLFVAVSAQAAMTGDDLGRSMVTADSVTTAAIIQPKNPQLAGAISILMPGMGHVYAGESVKGFVLTGLFVAGIGGVAAADIGQTHDSIKPAGWISVAFVGAVYFYALIDSPFAAERENGRLGRAHLMEFNVGGAMVSMDFTTLPSGAGATVRVIF